MKALDRWLRDWRLGKALKQIPSPTRTVFDIGCHDGYLFDQVPGELTRRDGCDPAIPAEVEEPGSLRLRGFFPQAVIDSPQMAGRRYDAIFALAVFEHFQAEDLRAASPVIASMLNDDGRLIATVPHPFVDTILHVLIFLRLIHGQEAHEHHGFDPRTLADEMPDLKLIVRRRFQLGLNYLFVFTRA